MAHILVIGAGIGGLPAAYELRAALGAGHRITVINAGMKRGNSEPVYEKFMLRALGIKRPVT